MKKEKKMKIIGIIAEKKEGKKKEKIFVPCDMSKLYIEYDGAKFEISDLNRE
jgi:hypothetical protein